MLSNLTKKEDELLMKELRKLQKIERIEDLLRKFPFLNKLAGEKKN